MSALNIHNLIETLKESNFRFPDSKDLRVAYFKEQRDLFFAAQTIAVKKNKIKSHKNARNLATYTNTVGEQE